MARRPPAADDDISLFPFLSIIACVIGVLTMMISTLALAQMDNKDVAKIEAYEKAQNELNKADEEIARIKQLLAEKLGPDAATVRENVVEDEQQLKELAKQLEDVQKRLAEQEKVKIVIPTLDPSQRETASSMQAELTSLKEELAQMEKDLSEREAANESKVSVLPPGSGQDFTPRFVECADGAILLHTVDPPKLIRAANMVTDKDFLTLLGQVANSPSQSIVFLVRSDGLNTYRAAKQICTEREIRNGKIPVVGKGRIDLSAFAEIQE